MADTFTPKLGLRQYDASLNYAVSKFSADNLLIDNAIGTVICTSTTRPSTGLYNGMVLWETDTQRKVIRVAGTWYTAPHVVTIANAAGRTAITTPYDGMTIYRQDFDWIEVYDGAAWRVQGHVVTAALANITNPLTHQTCTLTTDGFQYRWSGSAWTPYLCTTSAATAEYTRSTTQSIPTSTIQPLDYTTTAKSSTYISKATVSSGSEFTVLLAGRWLITGNGGLAGATGGNLRAMWISSGVDTPRASIMAITPGSPVFFHAFSVAKEIVYAVNDKFRINFYQDSGGAINTEVGQATHAVTMRWLGPA